MTHSISQEEDGTALVDGISHSQTKLPVSVERGESSLGVEVLLSQESGCQEVLVSHTHHHDGEGGVDQVKDCEVDSINWVGT